MKHGIICPVSQLEKYATRSNFHLILPHLIDKYPKYKEFYTERATAGDHVILDNSIFELGESYNYVKMLEYAEEMGLTEISIPEVLKDRDASRKLRDEFLTYYTKSGSNMRLLAVAQGNCIEDIRDSYFELSRIVEISTLGLPFDIDDCMPYDIKSLTLRRVMNRWFLVNMIDFESSMSCALKTKPTHLMGLSDAVELQMYSDYPWIRSNDSSSAFVHGVNGILYSNKGLPCEKISQKLDFGGFPILTDKQINDINFNIDTILSWIK